MPASCRDVRGRRSCGRHGDRIDWFTDTVAEPIKERRVDVRVAFGDGEKVQESFVGSASLGLPVGFEAFSAQRPTDRRHTDPVHRGDLLGSLLLLERVDEHLAVQRRGYLSTRDTGLVKEPVDHRSRTAVVGGELGTAPTLEVEPAVTRSTSSSGKGVPGGLASVSADTDIPG